MNLEDIHFAKEEAEVKRKNKSPTNEEEEKLLKKKIKKYEKLFSPPLSLRDKNTAFELAQKEIIRDKAQAYLLENNFSDQDTKVAAKTFRDLSRDITDTISIIEKQEQNKNKGEGESPLERLINKIDELRKTRKNPTKKNNYENTTKKEKHSEK